MVLHRARRIIFLNRYFYPDHAPTGELLSDLAFALAKRGLGVTVISSRLSYDITSSPLPPRERKDGVDIWRVWTSKRGRQRLLGRSLDYLTFYATAAWRLWRLARAGDIVVAKTDPPLLSVVTLPLVRLRRAHQINWIQDIFPEVAEALGLGGRLGHVAAKLLQPMRNHSLRQATTNVVVGEGMLPRLANQGISREKIRVIPNWSDASLIFPIAATANELRQHWGLSDHFVVGYAGNLGRAHDVETIIEAMTILQGNAHAMPEAVAGRIKFLFVGGGVRRLELERMISERKLRTALLKPYQPRELLAQTLGAADLHLISLNPKLEGLMVPSKFYGVAAAGRPMIFIGAADGEIARLIDQTRCGFTVAPGDGRALVERIIQLATDEELCRRMGERARAAFERDWDKACGIAKWHALLDAALASNPQRIRSPDS